MTTISRKGTTVEEAIQSALQALGVTREEVDITILEPGRKGFLGFGAKKAEISVTIREQLVVQQEPTEVEEVATLVKKSEELESTDPHEQAVIYLQAVTQQMGVKEIKVTHKTSSKYVYFQLESEQAGLLIGKRGQTLHALQQLTQLVFNQSSPAYRMIRLNVGEYRERRKIALQNLAERVADQAVRTGRKVQLEPMPSYDRKIIHHALANRLDVETYSEGKEPHRYLVIEAIR